MPKFKFESKKKNKFNFITNKEEILNSDIMNGAHLELFSNKKIIIEGCQNILDYQDEYIKLKLNKGFFNIIGSNFLITTFNDEKIIIKGIIISIEFCV